MVTMSSNTVDSRQTNLKQTELIANENQLQQTLYEEISLATGSSKVPKDRIEILLQRTRAFLQSARVRDSSPLELAHVTLLFTLRGFLAPGLFESASAERLNVSICEAVISALEKAGIAKHVRYTATAHPYFSPKVYEIGCN